MDEGKLWSFLRSVLDQGRAIDQDYRGGKYSSYEAMSARVDEAARERVEQFKERFGVPDSADPQRTEGA